MYYRVAIQVDPSPLWQWESTALSELSTLFQWLRLYHALPHDRLQVFSSCSREEWQFAVTRMVGDEVQKRSRPNRAMF